MVRRSVDPALVLLQDGSFFIIEVPESGCADCRFICIDAHTFDGLTHMSKKDDRTHCECVCDCGSTQYGAIDFYNKIKQQGKNCKKQDIMAEIDNRL